MLRLGVRGLRFQRRTILEVPLLYRARRAYGFGACESGEPRHPGHGNGDDAQSRSANHVQSRIAIGRAVRALGTCTRVRGGTGMEFKKTPKLGRGVVRTYRY